MRATVFLVAAAAAVAVVTGSAGQGEARTLSPACGAVITSDTSLQRNLTCSGTALYIGADNVVLDLNGHAITGDGTGDGVSIGLLAPPPVCAQSLVSVTNVIVENGSIKNFDVGIRLQPRSTHVSLQGLNIRGNVTAGIFGENVCNLGEGNDYLSITDNQIHDNQGYGTETGYHMASQLSTRYTVISGNEVYRNGGTGIRVAPYSDFSTIDNNHVHDNGGDGIDSSMSISTITNNDARNNVGSGIYAIPYFFPSASYLAGNTAVGNGQYGIDIEDVGVGDGGGDVARNNALGTQCVNIICTRS